MDVYTFQLGKWRKVQALPGVKIIDTTVRTGYAQVAPTWDMVLGSKSGVLTPEDYTSQHYEILRTSRGLNPRFWDALFRLEQVALGCYCKAGAFCHRHLLKQYLMEHTNALDKGELE